MVKISGTEPFTVANHPAPHFGQFSFDLDQDRQRADLHHNVLNEIFVMLGGDSGSKFPMHGTVCVQHPQNFANQRSTRVYLPAHRQWLEDSTLVIDLRIRVKTLDWPGCYSIHGNNDPHNSPAYLFSVIKDILTINPALKVKAETVFFFPLVHILPLSPPAWIKMAGTMNGGTLQSGFVSAYPTPFSIIGGLRREINMFSTIGTMRAYPVTLCKTPRADPGVHNIYFTECSGTYGSGWRSDIKWYMDNLWIGSLETFAGVGLMYNIALDGKGMIQYYL
ncbi:hypothetical protein B0H13DRAFT_1900982 [Mycena leptocephala]|nr:hypothetical protein B0H13DRAFT_1900982 [Mycena leptocephala]